MSTLYLAHFGLREPPFTITPNPRFFYTGGARGALLEALIVAVTTEEGITAAIGEVGSGKTMLARLLVDRLTQMGWQVAYLANPSFSPNEIVAAIAHDLGIPSHPEADSPITLIDRLNAALVARFRNGQRTAVVIDEAHAMPSASLDEVRRLANLETGEEKLLQIVLFGQPELAELLRERSLRPLAERIIHRFTIPPLPRPSVREYLEFRLRAAGLTGPIPFTPSAIARIGRVSGGIARRVNLLADKALLAAFARQAPRATRRDVRRAERDLTWSDLPYLHRAERWKMAAFLAFALALTVSGIAWWLATEKPILTRLLPTLFSTADLPFPPPLEKRAHPNEQVTLETNPSHEDENPSPPAAPSSSEQSVRHRSSPPPVKEPPQSNLLSRSAEQRSSPPRTRAARSSLREWQSQGYTHVIELGRLNANLTSEDQENFLARWRQRIGKSQHEVTLVPPRLPGEPIRVVLGPFRSSTQARQTLLELPSSVLLDEPRVIPLHTLFP